MFKIDARLGNRIALRFRIKETRDDVVRQLLHSLERKATDPSPRVAAKLT